MIIESSVGNPSHRYSRILECVVLMAIAASFALANGLAYGVSNHNQYLLRGLRALDSDYLAGDWFTCATMPHHSAFVPLMVLFSKIGPMPIMFAIGNAVAAGIFVLCLYAMARRWFERPLLVVGLAVFLIIIVPRPYVGLSSMIGMIFQPSTIGGVGLFAGLTLLSLGRLRNAGIALCVASVFHINYMVWAVLIVGPVVLLNYRVIKARGALWLLTPMAVAILYHLPFIAASRTAEQAVAAESASWILHDMYMPYHSRPHTWRIASFIQFGAVMAAGFVALAVAPPRRISGTAKSIAGAVAVIFVAGGVLTAIWQVEVVALLFPFRLAPFLITCAFLFIAGATVRALSSADVSITRCLALLCVVAGALYVCDVANYGFVTWCTIMSISVAGRAVSDMTANRGGLAAMWLGLMALSIVLGVGTLQLAMALSAIGIAVVCRLSASTHQVSVDRRFVGFGNGLFPALCLLLILVFVSRVGIHRKDLLGPRPAADDAELFDWCHSTPVGTQFVIPPDLIDFRLNAGRGVVIDWKCMPILPADTLTWYERLADVAGVRFTSLDQCLAGYRSLDAHRARRLARNYRANFVVTRADDHLGSLDEFPVVLSTDAWRVYCIQSPIGEALAADYVRDH